MTVEADAKGEVRPAKNGETVYARFSTAAFLEAMRTLAAVSPAARITLDEDGMNVEAVDPAHVERISLTLPASEGPTGEIEFGVDVEDVRDFVKRVMRSKRLAYAWTDLRIAPGDVPKITVKVGRFSKRFRYEDPADIAKPEKLELPGARAAATVDATEFRDALDVLSDSEDYVKLSLAPEGVGEPGLVIRANHSDNETTYRVGLSQLDYAKDVAPDLVNPDAHSMFPTSYIRGVIDALADNGGKVTLAVGLDYPLRMLWSTERGKVEVLIAPRITNDDE